MADVLEAMGFPSDWCETAMKSASGLETAVDLLLQWQVDGVPHILSQPLNSSSSKHAQQYANSRPSSSGAPTLRLLPIPATSSKAVVNEGQQSPCSTLRPSITSPGPSSLDCPSSVERAGSSESPSSSNARDIRRKGGMRPEASSSQIEQLERSCVDGLPGTGLSCIVGVSSIAETGTGSGSAVDDADSSDAVVPDAYAEERKARYLAARRAKQEKIEEKTRIRQQMQEDMALRRVRHNYQSAAEIERVKGPSPADHGEHSAGFSSSRELTADTLVELQIRCLGNKIIKSSFTAGAKLKDVRAFVEHQLKQPHTLLASQDLHSGACVASIPFTGQSARLSSDRQAERQLLQAARENFEVQTSRILESAKILRNNAGMPRNQSEGTMYFLIPFPRQEFFTESAMETTLAEAQLVPRGILVVHYRSSENEEAKREEIQPKVSTKVDDDSRATLLSGSSSLAEMNVDQVECQVDEFRGFEKTASCSDGTINEASKCGRTLEMHGERVRVRELALQAAAKRMSEAANIFIAGLPLEEGETGEAFHFPMDTVNGNVADDASSPEMNSLPQMVTRVDDIQSLNARISGADNDLVLTPHFSHLLSPGSSDPSKGQHDTSLDCLRRQAMAAAEARMKSSQPLGPVGSSKHELNEAESRIYDQEPESRSIRARARIPQSCRLLLRPEKLQRTLDRPIASDGLVAHEVPSDVDQVMVAESSSQRQAQPSADAACRTLPLEAALHRHKFNAISGADKGKGILEEHVSPEVSMPSSSVQVEAERNSLLRVRLEDGSVVLQTFPANTALQSVRDSVVPEGAVGSAYGFVVPFPEPHFLEGVALHATLEEVGLVPRGTIHLTKLATRGMVRQGRRYSRWSPQTGESDDEVDGIEDLFRHLSEHVHTQDLSYEALTAMEESVGRVCVGVPENLISSFPTHIVKAEKLEASTGDAPTEELDLCIVCMAELSGGEEALVLPCVHTFHTVCIRQWLLVSTCCPTCKRSLV